MRVVRYDNAADAVWSSRAVVIDTTEAERAVTLANTGMWDEVLNDTRQLLVTMPENADAHRRVTAAVQAEGAVPATVAILHGDLCVGLVEEGMRGRSRRAIG